MLHADKLFNRSLYSFFFFFFFFFFFLERWKKKKKTLKYELRNVPKPNINTHTCTITAGGVVLPIQAYIEGPRSIHNLLHSTKHTIAYSNLTDSRLQQSWL